MRTIWKFPLPMAVAGEPLSMPRGARIVHFDIQYSGPLDNGPRPGVPTLWVEVDPDQAAEPRQFVIIGTGHEIPADGQHVGSYQAEPFVWHVYEVPTVAWTAWEGGDCPVLGTMVVEYEQRDGQVREAPAMVLEWAQRGDPDDIVRYRLAAEQPAA